jgi:hypothetical protein
MPRIGQSLARVLKLAGGAPFHVRAEGTHRPTPRAVSRRQLSARVVSRVQQLVCGGSELQQIDVGDAQGLEL